MEVTVRTADLDALGERLTATAAELSGSAEDLRTAAQELAGRSSGEASEAAVMVHLRLAGALDARAAHLVRAGGAACALADAYAQADAEIALALGG